MSVLLYPTSKSDLMHDVSRFCEERLKEPESFLDEARAEDFKSFLKFVMDTYGVKASASLHNYWRLLKMHILDERGRILDDSIKRDILNVSHD